MVELKENLNRDFKKGLRGEIINIEPCNNSGGYCKTQCNSCRKEIKWDDGRVCKNSDNGGGCFGYGIYILKKALPRCLKDLLK